MSPDAIVAATQLLNGLSIAMILTLVGLGLGIIFGMMGVVNMAHGDLFMLGAVVTFLGTQFGVPFWLTVACAALAVGVIGLCVEHLLVRHIYHQLETTILATWGLGIAIRETVRLTLGSDIKRVDLPLEGSISFWGIDYPTYRIVLVMVCIVLLTLLYYLFTRTSIGLKARAVFLNREKAMLLGIPVPMFDRMTFFLGSSLAGMGGALVSPLISVDYSMGINYLVISFFVVVLGGLETIFGVAVGGFIMGASQGVFSIFAAPAVVELLVFTLAIVIVLARKRADT